MASAKENAQQDSSLLEESAAPVISNAPPVRGVPPTASDVPTTSKPSTEIVLPNVVLVYSTMGSLACLVTLHAMAALELLSSVIVANPS